MASEVPDADALDQEQEVTPDATDSAPTRDAEAPEADALEQAQRATGGARPTRDDEAPEADALEQSQEVPVDDDERP